MTPARGLYGISKIKAAQPNTIAPAGDQSCAARVDSQAVAAQAEIEDSIFLPHPPFWLCFLSLGWMCCRATPATKYDGALNYSGPTFVAKPVTPVDLPNASLLRRTAALIYDLFLIVALLFIGTFVATQMIGQGNSVSGIWFQLYLYLLILAFYTIFWRIKGQSLGMQVWRIRTVDEQGGIMSYTQCVLRFLTATFSFCALYLGFLWMLIDRKKMTWHDRLTRTRVVYLGNRPYESERRQKERDE